MKRFLKKLMVAILVLALAVIPSMGSYAATGVTFSGVGEIPNLRQGRPYDITGTVTASSGKKITYFRGQIWNISDGIKVAEISYNPNSATVNIHNSKVNNLKFGDLPEGEYTLYLYAKDSSGASKEISRHFWVESATTQMTFNINAPSYIPYKQTYNLTGTISGTAKITKVVGRIYKNGTEKQKVTVNCNTYTFNVGDSNINRNLKFGQLDRGDYLLKISAWDADGQHDEYYYFTVY